MFCANCGTEIPDESTTCPNCGEAPTITATAAPIDAKSEQKKIQKMSKAQYKDAKKVYKAARKAAGKSRVPSVILCIVIAVVLVAGGAFAMWFKLSPKSTDLANDKATLQEQVDKLKTENDELKAQIEKLQKDADDQAAKKEETKTQSTVAEKLVGEWKASSFDSTTTKYACYGGKAKLSDVSIKIKSVDEEAGQIIADVAVLYHGHDRTKLKADVQSSNEDELVKQADVVGTLKDGVFSFELAVDESYGNNSGLLITGELSEASSNSGIMSGFGKSSGTEPTVLLSVSSYFQSLSSAVTDVFTMKKL